MATLFRQKEFYIFNNPNKIEAAYGQLSSVKESLINQYQDKNFLMNQLKAEFQLKKKLPNNLIKTYFEFLDDIADAEFRSGSITNDIKQNLNKEIDKYDPYTNITSSFKGYNNMKDALDQLKNTKNVSILKDISAQLEKILTDVINQDNAPMELIKEFLLNPDIIETFETKGKFSTDFFNQVKDILTNTGTEKAKVIGLKDGARQGAVNKYLNVFQQIQTFVNLVNNLSKSEEGSVFIQKNTDIFHKIACGIISQIQQAMGFTFETYSAELADKKQEQEVQKMFNKIAGVTKLKITGENNVTSRSGHSTTSVQDIGGAKIKFFLEDNNHSSVQIEVPLPGSSVKHLAEIKKGNNKRIVKIKSGGANLSNLLHNMPKKNIALIYNLIASYGKKGWRGGYKFTSNPITAQHWTDFKEGLKTILLVNSLVGQMNESDFSYFFIVNGAVFTMQQVISSLFNEASGVKGYNMFTNSTAKNLSFSPSQETIMKLNSFILASGGNKVKYGKNKDQDLSPDTDAAIQRSSMAYNAMLKMKIRNEIKLSINNLT